MFFQQTGRDDGEAETTNVDCSHVNLWMHRTQLQKVSKRREKQPPERPGYL